MVLFVFKVDFLGTKSDLGLWKYGNARFWLFSKTAPKIAASVLS